MQSKAKTVPDYLKTLPPDRKKTLEAVLKVVRKNMPKGYEESMDFGMITWAVPLKVYPKTYNKRPLMYAALANQKNFLTLYLMGAYAKGPVEKDLKDGFKKAGKKLDMGKSCIHFKKADDMPLDVVGKAVKAFPMKEWISVYEGSRR